MTRTLPTTIKVRVMMLKIDQTVFHRIFSVDEENVVMEVMMLLLLVVNVRFESSCVVYWCVVSLR